MSAGLRSLSTDFVLYFIPACRNAPPSQPRGPVPGAAVVTAVSASVIQQLQDTGLITYISARSPSGAKDHASRLMDAVLSDPPHPSPTTDGALPPIAAAPPHSHSLTVAGIPPRLKSRIWATA